MELAYDSIHDLKKRNYFRPAFLDHLTSSRKIKCDGGSKEKIWSLMMQRLIQQSKCEPGRDFGGNNLGTDDVRTLAANA
jgi:hypothetical protein